MQTIELRSSRNAPSDGVGAALSEAWIDFQVDDDVGRQWLVHESGVDGPVRERLVEPASATYWRRFGQGFYLNMCAAVPGEDPSRVATINFGMWIEPGRIITVRYGDVPALDRAAAACSAGTGPAGIWGLLVFVLSSGLIRVERDLHELTAVIDRLEDTVLAGEGRPPIQRMAELRHRLVYARRFRIPLANMASFISAQHGAIVDTAARDELEGIVNGIEQSHELLGLSIERASALQGQIRDQLADSMNRATYRFTWVATVFLPLSFLTGLLGINVAGIPGDHNPLAFWLVCSVLSVIAAVWAVIVVRITRPFVRRNEARDP